MNQEYPPYTPPHTFKVGETWKTKPASDTMTWLITQVGKDFVEGRFPTPSRPICRMDLKRDDWIRVDPAGHDHQETQLKTTALKRRGK